MGEGAVLRRGGGTKTMGVKKKKPKKIRKKERKWNGKERVNEEICERPMSSNRNRRRASERAKDRDRVYCPFSDFNVIPVNRKESPPDGGGAVSYTHLTLPTRRTV